VVVQVNQISKWLKEKATFKGHSFSKDSQQPNGSYKIVQLSLISSHVVLPLQLSSLKIIPILQNFLSCPKTAI